MENQQKYLVAIKCITYNHEKYLADALEGFVMQKTNFPFVAIVHDDASTDGTAAILRQYAEKYPDIIKPIYETENQYSKHDGSLGRIMDEAVAATGAKYIAMCEGDDYWIDPYKLQKQVDFLEAHEEYSVCVHTVQAVKAQTRQKERFVFPIEGLLREDVFTLDDLCRMEFYEMEWVFQTSSFTYRNICAQYRSSAEMAYLNMFPMGDLPLLLCCLMLGKGYYIRDMMSCYRWESGGYMSARATNAEKNIKEKKQFLAAIVEFDKQTNYQYHKYILQRIKLTEYQCILSGDKNKLHLLRPRYWRCVPAKTVRGHMLYYLNVVAPSFRKWLKYIKHKKHDS